MGQQRTPGLVKRDGIWHIDKTVRGRRICRSTGTDRYREAEKQLAFFVDQQRNAEMYGMRPTRTFEEAAAKFLLEHQHKRSLRHDVYRLQQLLPWIGSLPIQKVHMGTLQPWLEDRRRVDRAPATINQGLQIVRRILNLAQSEWIDENGLSWLLSAPKIRLLPNLCRRLPHPLTWEEQDWLFAELPRHLANMAMFAVNTGCRDHEICSLRWDWEVPVPQMATSVFLIPGDFVKNGDERLVVLNDVARSVVETVRGEHNSHVFSFNGNPTQRMMNSAWLRARNTVELPTVRVHDLKHTFGRRLRAAGVSFEDRQDLLGHRSSRMTTHYSAAELSSLIESANRVCDRGDGRPELVVLRRRFG